MEQLIFELAAPEPPGFANFVAGPNAEVLAVLQRMVAGGLNETGVVLWGAPGAGKSHLLRAAVAAAALAGRASAYADSPGVAPTVPPNPGALVAVDGIDTADAPAQGRLFTLYNALAASGGQLVAAAALAPAQMALRDDLRTRLGYGLVYEVVPLGDTEKAAALEAYARGRGFRLSGDVIAYLLAHGRRDMATLVAILAALDRHSLAAKRPVTVPLLRDWLQRRSAADARK